jgi:hypothetical protein
MSALDWDAFKVNAKKWLADGYSCDIRYVAGYRDYINNLREFEIISAQVSFFPKRSQVDLNFEIETSTLVAGITQLPDLSVNDLEQIFDNIYPLGELKLEKRTLILPRSALVFNRVRHGDESWFQYLEGKVLTPYTLQNDFIHSTFSSALDDELRKGTKPFDGFTDLIRFLGLQDPRLGTFPQSVKVLVSPPVDVQFNTSVLDNNRLSLNLIGHHKLVHTDVEVAIIASPGEGVSSRSKVTGDVFTWTLQEDGTLNGSKSLDLNNANQVLVMLVLGDACIRRHWFADPSKAGNLRYLALNALDKNLGKMRYYLFENEASDLFEKAIENLAFLRGYTPCIPFPTDAPDIILATPGGQLALVECTLKVSKVQEKVGKLVDRRHAMQEALRNQGIVRDVPSILVVRQSRAEIASNSDQIRQQGIKLITREDLENWMNQLRDTIDTDAELLSVIAELNQPIPPPVMLGQDESGDLFN